MSRGRLSPGNLDGIVDDILEDTGFNEAGAIKPRKSHAQKYYDAQT